jgi:hypothetical protein
MMRVYSDPTRENETYALPDVEVWYQGDAKQDSDCDGPGWYYWFCFPGCLPDSDPFGPYDTQAAAIAAMREMWSD